MTATEADLAWKLYRRERDRSAVPPGWFDDDLWTWAVNRARWALDRSGR